MLAKPDLGPQAVGLAGNGRGLNQQGAGPLGDHMNCGKAKPVAFASPLPRHETPRQRHQHLWRNRRAVIFDLQPTVGGQYQADRSATAVAQGVFNQIAHHHGNRIRIDCRHHQHAGQGQHHAPCIRTMCKVIRHQPQDQPDIVRGFHDKLRAIGPGKPDQPFRQPRQAFQRDLYVVGRSDGFGLLGLLTQSLTLRNRPCQRRAQLMRGVRGKGAFGIKGKAKPLKQLVLRHGNGLQFGR